MVKCRKLIPPMLFLVCGLFVFLAYAAERPKPKPGAKEAPSAQAVQGRYITMISGCNDCHTPGYLQSEAKVPESDWLTGDTMG